MNAMLGLLVPALLGVDFGWQRRSNDTIEYIVQVDPETFAEMQATGRSIGSALPANLRGRIGELTFRVGRESLPNQNTLPPDDASSPADAAPRLIDAAGADADAQPIRRTSGYQPPGSPGGDTSWASQATSARWPSSPTAVPTTSPGTTTSAWPSTTPARYGDNVALPPPPTSTSGFPINPTAPPPATTTTSGTGFPGSALGTLPPSTSVPTPTNSGAWPSTTAPPSLSSGPRVTQPSPWSAQPREVSITARMPAETTSAAPNTGALPPTSSYVSNGPPPGYYPPSNYQPQPTTQYAQAGYPPPATSQPGQPYPPTTAPPVAVREPASPHPTTPATSAASESNGLMWALAVIGLLTSLACNFYFGWSTYQIRERYRMLLVDRNAYST